MDGFLLRVFRVHVRIQFMSAFRAYTVAELGVCMPRYVIFNPFPALVIIPDVMAVHAYGQDSLQRLDMLISLFQRLDTLGQFNLICSSPSFTLARSSLALKGFSI